MENSLHPPETAIKVEKINIHAENNRNLSQFEKGRNEKTNDELATKSVVANKNDFIVQDKKDSIVQQGGLQIKRNQSVKNNESEEQIGGISTAIMPIPFNLDKLNPSKQIGPHEPVFPTQSRIFRVNFEKLKKKEKCAKKCGRRAALYDLWAIQTIPHSETIAFNICIALAPILITITIWDMLAVIVFTIPHFSTLNLPGVLYPFYPIGTICSFYSYMVRFLTEDVSKRTYISFIGVFIYPLLLIWRCVFHYHFNGYRDERKLWY